MTHYGFVIPGGEIVTLVELAREAEEAGWDGVFIPDCIYIDSELDPMMPAFDPWVMLGAMATRTQHIKLGTMITPLSRRRPWKVARETMTIDQLSHGRLILPVGLGALDDAGFGKVGEATERKTRAQLLDESLEIITGLWSGKPFHYDGRHYHLQEMVFLPPAVQTPRIPIWVVGAWPREKSMQRVVQYDGLLPNKLNDDGTMGEITPQDIRAMKAYITERRTLKTPFDIIWEGQTPGADRAQGAAQVAPWIEAGITWWMESMWPSPDFHPTLDDVRARIQQGPPRIN